jgi:hypothetical protein
MRDSKVTDKEREKYYRDYINRLKLPESSRISDLTKALKALPLTALNNSNTLVSLPSVLLVDLTYYTLPATKRDSLVATYITTLPPPPTDTEVSGLSAEDEAKIKERERRTQALADRERRVRQEERKRERDLAISRDRLREEEAQVARAMKIGKDGLRSHLAPKADDDDLESR